VKNHIAIITGASRGLGATLARLLAGRGVTLVLNARTAPDLDRIGAELRARGATVRTEAGDLADPSTRRRLVAHAQELGGLDLLINNASELGGLAPLGDVRSEQLERIFRVNVVAPVALIAEALPLLTGRADRRALVINVTSDAATGAYAGWGAYGASKAALDLASRTLAGELAAKGVAVVAVDPGDMRTRMHQEAFPDDDISDRPLPDVTRPFFEWLLDQDPAQLSGRRFQAQAARELWALSA
jgi:NAD(P)-dependent dehydrogenase (short-subunit alcohol dehydrogenase family)